MNDSTSMSDTPCPLNTTIVMVTVIGSGDIAPSFDNKTHEGAVDEGSKPGTQIVQVGNYNLQVILHFTTVCHYIHNGLPSF